MQQSIAHLLPISAVTAEQIVANVQDETLSVQQSTGSTDAVVPSPKSFSASWAQLLPEAASKLERRVSAPASASLPASPLCAEFDELFADPQRLDLSYRLRIEANPLVEVKALGQFNAFARESVAPSQRQDVSPVKRKLSEVSVDMQSKIADARELFLANSNLTNVPPSKSVLPESTARIVQRKLLEIEVNAHGLDQDIQEVISLMQCSV